MTLAELGRTLREWRELAGLTQAEAARLTGLAHMTRNVINAIEHGERYTSVEEMQALTRLYRVAPVVAVDALTRDDTTFQDTLAQLAENLGPADRATLLHAALLLNVGAANRE